MHRVEKLNVIYAGFWLRASALLIDVLLIALFFYIFRDFLPHGILSYLVKILFSWFYFAFLHSSSWKATVGKKFVGIQVVNYIGERINFKKASIRYFASLVSSLLVLPYLTVVFTKKKQAMHDMIAKTVVVDAAYLLKNDMYNPDKAYHVKVFKKENNTLGRKIAYIFAVLFFGALLYVSYPLIALFLVYGYMYTEKNIAYNKSFHTHYPEKEFNDSRVDFYKKELEKSSKNLVNAHGIVDIFEYDTKVDLALDCIQYYIKDNNETDWIEEGSRIRKNARNKFTINDDLIERVKANEDSMGKNFYLYDLNLVNDITSDITNLWHDKSKKSLCDQNLSANQLYDTFLTSYLTRYIDKHISSSQRKLSESDDRDFLARKHNQEKEWLKKISLTSSQYIFQKYSLGEVSLEDVSKHNHFQASIVTYDVVYNSKNIIVGDFKRGIELWSVDANSKFNYLKTLTDKYGIFKIKKVGDIIFATGQEKQKVHSNQHDYYKDNYFLTFSYDDSTDSLLELDKVQLGKYSRVGDWNFFDNNNKVATVSGYDRVHILDISNPKILKVIQQSKEESNNNYSMDLTINEITGKLFELASYGLNVIDVNKFSLFKKRIENNFNSSFKGHQGIVIDQKDNILYSIHITWENETTLYKYDMQNPLKPKLLSFKKLDINFDGWNGGPFPNNMQFSNGKLYVANRNNIYIFDEELNNIESIRTPNIKNFYILEDKIVYTKGKLGLSLILKPKNL